MNGNLPERERTSRITFKKILGSLALASLICSLLVLGLLLRKPSIPDVEAAPAATQSFTDKVARLTLAHEQHIPSEIRLTEAEINSQIKDGLRAHPPPAGEAAIKGATVRFEGDKLVTVLAMNVKGRDIYITVGGHLNFADRAIKLVPSEVHIGSLPVPVSWMESKIDLHMELPEGITGMRVENGELVVEAD
jgi:hypothetical protein